MKRETKVIFVAVLVSFTGCAVSKPYKCNGENTPHQEGNIGESGSFNWLGVLRVHLHDRTTRTFKVALTGLILVKDQYAIANAGDVVAIPHHIFRDDSKAMFIADSGSPWSCRPKSYMAHPEYEYSTYITIALIELDIGGDISSPLTPICWPGYSFNTSNQLYALGYTDEHQLLEKVLYKIQYVDRPVCEEFYDRIGSKQNKFTAPIYYQCGFAVNNKNNCIWENGMALASNSTGQWHLIGLGIRGPGCAGPARFIDIFHYLPWIESSTTFQEVPDYF